MIPHLCCLRINDFLVFSITDVVLFCADICLKEVPSIADSMYNIELLREFSNEHLNKCFYLKPEDMLYSPPVLKVSPKTLHSQKILLQ